MMSHARSTQVESMADMDIVAFADMMKQQAARWAAWIADMQEVDGGDGRAAAGDHRCR